MFIILDFNILLPVFQVSVQTIVVHKHKLPDVMYQPAGVNLSAGPLAAHSVPQLRAVKKTVVITKTVFITTEASKMLKTSYKCFSFQGFAIELWDFKKKIFLIILNPH